MRNTQTRFLALCMAIVLACAALAGCGSDKKSTGKETVNKSEKKQQSGGKVQQNDDSSFFDNIPAELIGTTVYFATWIDHRQTEAAPVLDAFVEDTGIDFELDTIPQGDYITKLSAKIAAGQSPDVVVENGDWPRTLKCLMPLTDAGVDVTDPFWDQNIVKYSTIGKKTYLVNAKNSIWNMSSACCYYNKAIFEDYGIKTPTEYMKENNWTWDTYKKVMRDVHSADPGLVGGGFDANAFTRSYSGLWVQFDPDTDKFYNVSKNAELLDTYRYMLECKEAGIAEIAPNGPVESFKTGKCAMCIAGNYGLRATGWLNTMDPDDVAFAELPKRKASDSKYPSGSTFRSYGICKGSKNAVAAGYFLRYFLNGDNYSDSDIYLNKEAKKWYIDLRDRMDMTQMHWTGGIYGTLYSAGCGYMTDLLAGTSAQVSTNIAKVSAMLDACIAEGNNIIKDVIAKQ